MSRRSTYPISMSSVLILWAFLTLDIVLVSGQDQEQVGKSPSQLMLTLEVEKQAFVLGEPVYISVQLRNTGTTPAKVAKVLDPQAGTVTVQIDATDHQPTLFAPLFYADVTAPLVELGQDEAITAILPIFFGAQGWTFSNPGQYRIITTYHHPERKDPKLVQSNSIHLTVSKGNGAGSFLMKDSVKSLEAGKLLLWRQGDHLRDGAAHLSEIVQKYPDSPVSDYANLALGSNLAQPFRDYSANKVRQPNYPLALAYLRKVRDSQLPRYLKIQKNLDQARCLFNIGEVASVKDFIREAQKLSQDRSEFQPLLDKARRLEPRLKSYF